MHAAAQGLFGVFDASVVADAAWLLHQRIGPSQIEVIVANDALRHFSLQDIVTKKWGDVLQNRFVETKLGDELLEPVIWRNT